MKLLLLASFWPSLPGYYETKSGAGAHSCLLVILMVVLASAATTPDEVLLKLKEEWQATLPTWINGTNPCDTWEGVVCNSQGELIALNLQNKGLNGAVPIIIGKLVSLKFLDLGNNISLLGPWNHIQGDLAPLSSLKNLQFLNFSFNILETGFPSVVLQLTELIDLRLDNSFITGPFPTGLSNLVNLQYLYLGNCTMTGALPAELGKLSNLRELTLWNNQFNSRLPVELSNLSNLTYLNLHSCNLWGGLPPEYGKLENMRTLHLYNNHFTGTIPDNWKKMQKLEGLRLNRNHLTKTFPSWILQLSSLSIIYLSYNQMYGPIPDLSGSNFTLVRLECDYFNGSAPIVPSRTRLYADANCYSNVTTENDNSIHTCGRVLSCSEFFKHLSQDGCPPCPTNQILLNISSCVCERKGDTGESSSNKNLIAWIVGPIAAVLVLIFLIIVIRKLQLLSRGFFSKKETHNFDWEVPKGIQRFTLHEVAKATADFHEDRVIGIGSFGKVYYGNLDSGEEVAIKRASPLKMQGCSEFQTEILLLSRLHHCNLVRLLGYCEDDGVQILVYDFMSNGNLHNYLFRNNLLNWYKRLEIMLGIAQGLQYLHFFADPPVIHRDVKPSNILLDQNLVPKLADFGLSKATIEFQTHISTRPFGTAGYMDPEYILRNQLTTASDVYSFGVVLLELITGQKAIEEDREEHQNLVEWVQLKMTSDGIEGIIDPHIKDSYPQHIYDGIAQLAIKCASFRKDVRPSMKEVVNFLEVELHALSASTSSVKPDDGSKKGSMEEGSFPPSFSEFSEAMETEDSC